MRSLIRIAVMCAIIGAGGVCRGEESARVVLLEIADGSPPAAQVAEHLQVQLDRVEVRVDIQEAAVFPESLDAWRTLGDKATAAAPGTLALYGWKCGDDDKAGCVLYAVEAESRAVTVLPVEPEALEDGTRPSNAFAIAAVIRECAWGGLPVVLDRLAGEGRRPRIPPSLGHSLTAPAPEQTPSAALGLGRGGLPWIWLEGGYRGEYPYPEGRTIHGPWVGLALSPGKRLVPVLTLGWLGKRTGESEVGEASSHRFPLTLSVRLAFPVGPALFSVAPVGRVDLVISESNPYGPRGETSETDVELHVGGEMTWHLPLPGEKLEIVLGVTGLGTVLGNDYSVDDTVTIPASDLRISWTAGIAWTPLDR